MIIKGVTQQGKTFRPSDWPERLCGRLSTFTHRRINYNEFLTPTTIDGVRCVRVDPRLVTVHPSLHKSIIEFVEINQLQVMTDAHL